ncbi:CdaR family protein [Streptococcus pneumoniae]
MKAKKIWYIISSLFFAVVLFIYASSSNYQNNTNARQTKSETYTNTLPNVPIETRYDSDEYFISGLSTDVSVILTGSNRLTLASEMQESTRRFKVVADLTGKGEGVIEVPLKIENLPSGLTAMLNPDKISVKIGKKASKVVKVKFSYEPAQVASNMTIDSISLADKEVLVTSDEETLSRVDHVEALLPVNEVISGNYSATLPLQAVDENREILSSVVTPLETLVKVTVKSTTSNSSSTNSSSSSSH